MVDAAVAAVLETYLKLNEGGRKLDAIAGVSRQQQVI